MQTEAIFAVSSPFAATPGNLLLQANKPRAVPPLIVQPRT